MVQQAFGGPEVLALVDRPVPTPGPGEVLVRVAACGLNNLDLLQRTGVVRLPGLTLPHVAGMDVAGVVEQVGGDVAVPLGARVVLDPSVPCGSCASCDEGRGGHCPQLRIVGGNVDGGLAEYVVAPAVAVHRIPDGADLVEAACLPSPWATAWHAVVTVGRLQAGETLVVHSAAGSVGLAAVQIARSLGAQVVATVASEHKIAALRAVGVQHALIGADSAQDTVLEVTGGRGADLALEHVGPATWAASTAALRVGGRLVFLGNSSGDAITFSLSDAFHRGLQLLGAGAYLASDMTAALETYWGGSHQVLVAAEHVLADTAAAQAQLADRGTVGRVLVRP